MVFKVACRIGKFPEEVKQLPYIDLIKFVEFFDIELKNHTKQDYYLAQIAAMLSSKKARIKDFLIKFKEPAKKLSPKEFAIRIAKAFGIDARAKVEENIKKAKEKQDKENKNCQD